MRWNVLVNEFGAYRTDPDENGEFSYLEARAKADDLNGWNEPLTFRDHIDGLLRTFRELVGVKANG